VNHRRKHFIKLAESVAVAGTDALDNLCFRSNIFRNRIPRFAFGEK
jgi:hypothetical protein